MSVAKRCRLQDISLRVIMYWLCPVLYVWFLDRKPHHSSKFEPSADIHRWAVECCHRCLIYLGDLGNHRRFYCCCCYRCTLIVLLKPFDAHCCQWTTNRNWHICHIGTAIKHHCAWAPECPTVKNYKWRLNLVWHSKLYSCTHMATVGIKGLTNLNCCWVVIIIRSCRHQRSVVSTR